MGALSWIVLGLVAGLIAKWVTSGYEPRGCIVTIVIGIVGAAIGGWVGTQFVLVQWKLETSPLGVSEW